MILADTSVWVDYFREGNATFSSLLSRGNVLIHPCVIGELAVGNLRDRQFILSSLRELVPTTIASDSDVLEFIDRHRLFGLGIGYVDCHLLASVMLTPGASFWTRDKRLSLVAGQLGLAAAFPEDSNGAKP